MVVAVVVDTATSTGVLTAGTPTTPAADGRHRAVQRPPLSSPPDGHPPPVISSPAVTTSPPPLLSVSSHRPSSPLRRRRRPRGHCLRHHHLYGLRRHRRPCPWSRGGYAIDAVVVVDESTTATKAQQRWWWHPQQRWCSALAVDVEVTSTCDIHWSRGRFRTTFLQALREGVPGGRRERGRPFMDGTTEKTDLTGARGDSEPRACCTRVEDSLRCT